MNKVHNLKGKNQFFDGIRPIMYAFKILGKSSFKIESGFLKNSKNWSFSTAFWLSVYILECVLSVSSIVQNWSLFQNEMGFIDNLKILMSFLLDGSHLFMRPISNLLETNKLIDYVNGWEKFEEQYFSVTGRHLKPKLTKLVSWSIVLIPLSSLILVYLENKATFGKNWAVLLLYFYNMNVYLFYFLFWLVCLVETSRAAVRIRRIIKVTYNTSRMGRIRKLWITLARLNTNFGHSVCYTVLMILSLFYLCMITSSYAAIASAFCAVKTGSFEIFSIFAFSSFIIYFYVELAHRTSLFIGKDIYEALVEFDVGEMDLSFYNEHNKFLQVIQETDPRVSLGGFISVSRQTISKMIENSLTYLVVLVQFSATCERM